MAHRIFGIWYCPTSSCLCERNFVSHTNENDDPDFAECDFCGYQYGKCVDETGHDFHTRIKPRLDRQLVHRGFVKHRAIVAARKAALGLPTKGLPDEIRNEYKRRMGLV